MNCKWNESDSKVHITYYCTISTHDQSSSKVDVLYTFSILVLYAHSIERWSAMLSVSSSDSLSLSEALRCQFVSLCINRNCFLGFSFKFVSSSVAQFPVSPQLLHSSCVVSLYSNMIASLQQLNCIWQIDLWLSAILGQFSNAIYHCNLVLWYHGSKYLCRQYEQFLINIYLIETWYSHTAGTVSTSALKHLL